MKKNFYKKYILFIIIFLIMRLSSNAGDIKIVSQPVSVDECAGKPATLLVDAVSESKQKLFYHWYKDQNLIPDATSPLIEFKSLKFDESGLYFCRITNDDSSETLDSRAAAVYALSPTQITEEPKGVVYYVFDNSDTNTAVLSFTVHIADSANNDIKIQWYMINYNGTTKLDENLAYIKRQFAGTQSNNLSIKIKDLGDLTQFYAIVTGKCGSDTTKIVKITKIKVSLEITQPDDIISCAGKNGVLHSEVTVSGFDLKFDYHWYKDGKPLLPKSNIEGINSPDLTFDPVTSEDIGSYYLEAKIEDKNYTVYSNPARLSVTESPKIISFWSDTSELFSTFFEDDFDSVNGVTALVCALLRHQIGDTIRIDDDFHKYYTDTIYKHHPHVIEGDNPFIPFYQYGRNNPVRFAVLGTENVYKRKCWATVLNACGSVTSDTIILGKNNAKWGIVPIYPKISYFTFAYNQCKGKDIVLKRDFYTSLNRKILYQWYRSVNTGNLIDTGYIALKDDDRISGSQSSQLTVKNAQIDDFDAYLLRATIEGSDSSLDASTLVTIYDHPTMLLSQPNDQTLAEDTQEEFFNLKVNQKYTDLKVFYRKTEHDPWRFVCTDWTNEDGIFNFNHISHHLGTIVGPDPVLLTFDGYYYAEIANPCGDPVYTDTVKITVIPKNGVGIISGLTDSHVETQDVYFYHTPPSPIPATNLIRSTIYWNSSYQLGNIQTSVYDIYGAKIEKPDIYFDAINNYSANLFWNCAAFEPGIYFIRVSLAGENMSIPVIVAR